MLQPVQNAAAVHGATFRKHEQRIGNLLTERYENGGAQPKHLLTESAKEEFPKDRSGGHRG